MICGHEEDAALLRGDSIQRIEQPAEGHALTSIAGSWGSASEDGVNVLEKNQRLLWSLPQITCKCVISEILVVEIQNADVQFELTRKDLDESSLSATFGVKITKSLRQNFLFGKI